MVHLCRTVARLAADPDIRAKQRGCIKISPVARASPGRPVRVTARAGTSRRMSTPAGAPIAEGGGPAVGDAGGGGGGADLAAAGPWLAGRLVGGTLRLPQGLNPFLAVEQAGRAGRSDGTAGDNRQR